MKINNQTITGGTQQFADTINNDNSRHQSINGNISNSNVNFGDNSSLSNAIAGLPPENAELKALLTQLQALINSSTLSEQDKKEALAETKTIVEATEKPPEEQQSLVRKTIRYFKGLSADLGELPETALALGKTMVQIGCLFGVLT